MLPKSLLSLLLTLVTSLALAHPPPVFLATADSPYDDKDLPQLETLYRNAGKVTFLAHLGDIKSGINTCDDEHYQRIAEMFRAQQAPMVYSPGDNDWTDCRRLIAGDYDPQERLAKLRQIFFDDSTVLRLEQLPAHRPKSLEKDFPELFWFRYGHVLFINWHIVGSNNNRNPDDPAALAEYQARTEANTLITAAALKGYKGYLRAIVIMTHASMSLDKPVPPRAFRPTHRLLAKLLEETKVPILLIHGDDHEYLHDQPWLGRPNGDRLWRLELPGHPKVGGVKVELSKDKAYPFQFTEVGNDADPLKPAPPPD